MLEQDFAVALAERTIIEKEWFAVTDGKLRNAEHEWEFKKQLEGNGEFQLGRQHIAGAFAGKLGPYQLRLKLPRRMDRANGLTVRYRISGWSEIRYLAIGHTTSKGFRHVKINNPAQDDWVSFSVGYRDLAYGLQNNWEVHAPGQIADVRLYISGTPSDEGGRIDCAWACVWLENEAPTLPEEEFQSNSELFVALKRYFTRCNLKIDEQVERFLRAGACPMTGNFSLAWPIDKAQPTELPESGTYRYLWHAMQPAISLMVYADNHRSQAAIHAARDYISNWLERSFFNVDPDTKYTWYDHGTAERLMALLLMHDIGMQQQFDYRFMARVRVAIIRHGQLLESEVFYAYHQPTRYHNHAWFQDMALIAVAVAMPELPSAERWLNRAIARLEDQLDTLIVRDGGLAIFVENSIGYHHGIQRLVEFAGELVTLSGKKTNIPGIARELNAWSEFLRYPDRRAPSQGDTFRKPNPTKLEEKILRGKPYPEPSFTVLPKAGYAVVKGNHDGKPWMLCMFATSLCKTHKHEDNLSITFWFDGIEWLIDPSFYSHDYTDAIPAYLRSAQAHNNIWIPEAAYSIEPDRAKINGRNKGEYFELYGEHTAYRDFLIKRKIEGVLTCLDIKCVDSVECLNGDNVAPIHLVYHPGEGVHCSLEGQVITLVSSLSKYSIQISLLSAAKVDILNNGKKYGEPCGSIGQGYREAEFSDVFEVEFLSGNVQWKISPFLNVGVG